MIPVWGTSTGGNGSRPIVDLQFNNGVYYNSGNGYAIGSYPGWSFTRASAGYAANAAGLLLPFAPGDPRITDLGILVEEARTNILTYSQDFTNAAWTKSQTAVTANQAVAPDGTTTADKLDETAVTNTHSSSQTIVVVTATGYAISVYAKAAERTFIGVYEGVLGKGKWFNLSTGAVGGNLVAAPNSASIESVGNGWYRCTITITTASIVATPSVYLSTDGSTLSYLGVAGSGVYLWQAQCEAGSFATSPITTTAAAVTRAADVPIITGIAGLLSGTLLVDATAVNATAEAGVGGVNPSIASISDGATGANAVILNRGPTSNAANFRVRVGGVDQASIGTNAWANGTRKRFASRYQTDNFACSLAGLAVETDVSGTIPTGLTQLNIGMNRQSSTGFWNSYVGRILIPNSVYSDAQLVAWSA